MGLWEYKYVARNFERQRNNGRAERVWTRIQNSDSRQRMKRKFIFPVIWILWAYSFSSDSSYWRYQDEFKTREECLKAMEPYLASALERRSGEGAVYYCFPDTADLRSL